MTDTTDAPDIRALILRDPDLILEDQALMQALLAADRKAYGRKVVDLRGVLVERLEERLDRLQDTHREVLAAAYDNVAGMNQIHRASLALLEPADFEGFLTVLTRDVAPMLGVEVIRLALEVPGAEAGSSIGPGALREAVIGLPEGGVDAYLTLGRNVAPRAVTLRRADPPLDDVYGEHAGRVHSEALLRLDLGPNGPIGVLALGAADARRFNAEQGTDLITFFAAVLERTLRRFVA
ncbi:hypothetical protein HNP73_000789 [Amaricoccus macauensis]|uniref:DUF484 family protein n=1 Tax=Amaricoccus macauensis TaxID=57001 RepID=A0A840SL42_9RHOB|nr:DUF484 family protein [Amaricoccus macauensis]MBB5220868.1 hypothetical protein [Amaricoccus macauensis]